MSQSTEHQDGNAQDYAAMIKVGDAVETPDGALWVVSAKNELSALLRSAYRGEQDGQIHRDLETDAVETAVPLTMLLKVCDARQVRR